MQAQTLTETLASDAPVADILLAAAGHAEAHDGPDTRTLVADAIGVALGHLTPAEVDWHIIPAVIYGDDELPHLAFAVVMARLGGSIQDVFMWSEPRQSAEIAEMLRDCASEVTCLSCGAPYGQPHRAGCGFELATDAGVAA